MRVLVVDSYYDMFVSDFYARNSRLESRSYSEQLDAIMGEAFGTADFYSQNLSALGHPSQEVVATCEQLQLQWAREHGVPVKRSLLRFPSSPRIPRLFRFRHKQLEMILHAQIEEFMPQVVHFQDPLAISKELLSRLRTDGRILTAQVASYVPDFAAFGGFDLILSSFPHFVKRFAEAGVRSAFLGLGFESSIISRLKDGNKHDVVFVGGLSARHPLRRAWLEAVAKQVPIKWWGYGRESLPADSPLHRVHQGRAWGMEMYNIFFNSRIVLNFNEPVQARIPSEDHANNMRLYEATGTGALLLTDYKGDLGSLFVEDAEVIAYRTASECVEKIRYYLANESARNSVARAGQARTLRDHTFRIRMKEFADIVAPLLP